MTSNDIDKHMTPEQRAYLRVLEAEWLAIEKQNEKLRASLQIMETKIAMMKEQAA